LALSELPIHPYFLDVLTKRPRSLRIPGRLWQIDTEPKGAEGPLRQDCSGRRQRSGLSRTDVCCAYTELFGSLLLYVLPIELRLRARCSPGRRRR
jgi:hypothetical protein